MGDRSQFREWNDKLLSACAHVKPSYRKAMHKLNKKLNSLRGIVPDEEEEGPVTQGDLLMAGKLRRSSRRLSRDIGYEAGVGSYPAPA